MQESEEASMSASGKRKKIIASVFPFVFCFCVLVLSTLSGCLTRVDLYSRLNSSDLSLRMGSQLLPDGSGSCDFGSVELFNTSPRIFTIENNSLVNISITSISLSTGDSSEFLIDATPTLSNIAPGTSTIFTVFFKPTSVGYKKASIRLLTTGSDSGTYTFNVTGYGMTAISEPDITVNQGKTFLPNSTGEYDFGNIDEGLSSPVVTFTARNSGNADLSISDVAFNSGDTDQFSIIAPSIPTILSPSTSTTFTVTFSPTSAGDKTAEVRIFNDDPDENPYTFTVRGYGEPVPCPEIVIMQGVNELSSGTGSFDFGHVLSSGSSAPAPFSIENTGTGELTIGNITLISGDTDQFILEPLPSSPVVPGGATTFEITFSPLSPGFFSAVVAVENNDPDENPFNFTVNGYGDSVACPDISLPDVEKTGSYDLGKKKFGETSVKEFTIKNVGTGNLFITSVSLTDGQTTQFRLNIMTMSSNVAPGDDTKFSVEFVPTETGGISAELSIDTNDPDEDPFVFTVTGTGESHPIPDIALYRGSTYYADGSRFDFGTVFFSESKTFTIENTGDDELLINNILLVEGDPDFYLDTTSTSFFIPQGGSTSFNILFDPAGLGDKWRNLVINSNDPNESPYNLRLEGNY
jgi:hypothetical protein